MNGLNRTPRLWPAMGLALLSVVPWMTGCPAKEPVPPIPDASDGGPLDTDAGAPVDDAAPATCSAWCKHAADLKCPAAKDTPAGTHCVDVCGTVQAGGIVSWNLKCRIAAKTCAAADACEKGK